VYLPFGFFFQIQFDHPVMFYQLLECFRLAFRAECVMVDIEAQCRHSLPCCCFRGILRDWANYESTHLEFSVGVNLPPSVDPDFRSLPAFVTAEKTVLIPWSIQGIYSSFRPRCLPNSTVFD